MDLPYPRFAVHRHRFRIGLKSGQDVLTTRGGLPSSRFGRRGSGMADLRPRVDLCIGFGRMGGAVFPCAPRSQQ